MPAPHLRTRNKRRVRVTLPGGRSKTRYTIKNARIPSCSICGKTLAGIGHLTTGKSLKLNRSKRRIWRPYGGQLCHNCLKIALKQTVRSS